MGFHGGYRGAQDSFAPRTRCARAAQIGAALLIAVAWLAAGPGAAGGPGPARAAAAKGIIDCGLEASVAGSPERTALVREARTDLGARWVRVIADWSRLEPTQGAWDAASLAQLDSLVADLHGAGLRVLLTTCYVPRWASDSSFWDDPPPGVASGYRSFYPIRDDALDDYAGFAELLATRYAGRIDGLECWNEPNLWGYLYPQRVAGDADFGARVYLRMLRAFARGVRRAPRGSGVRIVAGATAPVGLNDKLRTSPQCFARFLRAQGAAAYFDVYSHHPYTPGGSLYAAPDQPPNDPRTTVTLYNLRTLLRLFPRKPFFLSEYGYNTDACLDFGGFAVSESVQASYLRRAYAYAGRYAQVRVLFWYLIGDAQPASGPSELGVYTGLRRASGARKPAWYAYAGGAGANLCVSARARSGSLVTLRGRALWRGTAAPGQALVLQGRRLGTDHWYQLAQTTSDADGRYRLRLRFLSAAQFRTAWPGVRVSAVRTVRVR
jgi:polysaccharide biosynthesis protein PslG